MSPEDMKRAWRQRAERDERLGLASSRLRVAPISANDIEQRVRRLERQVLRRDVAETVAAVLSGLFFSSIAQQASLPIVRLGSWFLVAVAVAIPLHLHRTRRRERPPDAWLPLIEYCRRARARVDGQIGLLRSVLWWYVAPILLGINLVFAAGTGFGRPAIVYALCSCGAGVVIYWLNQQAAARLEPFRQELDACVRGLEANGAAE